MKETDERYVPALGYHWLTGLYDPLVALTTRERTFKRELIRQARVGDGDRVLDLACGTPSLLSGFTALMAKPVKKASPVPLLTVRRASRDTPRPALAGEGDLGNSRMATLNGEDRSTLPRRALA